MNPQAVELNAILQEDNPTILKMLSEKGKRIFFPRKGLMAQSMEAKGKSINATIGMASEEDGSPMRLSSIAGKVALSPEKVFPYSTSYGHPELRKMWRRFLEEKNPGLQGKTLSLPVVTSALTHGLSLAGYLFVNPGDPVLIPDLFWGNYTLIFKNGYGGEIVNYGFFSNGGFALDNFEKALWGTESKKVILVLNFPNNPTGYTPSPEEMKQMADIVKKAAAGGKKIVALIDDAYFGLIYDEGTATESVFSFFADLHENVLAVKLDGATKEDFVWGFRIGFITFNSIGMTERSLKILEEKTAGALRGSISNCSQLSQNLLLEAFNSPQYADEKKVKFSVLKSRYELVKKILAEKTEYGRYFEPLPFNSGYFMCIRLKGVDTETVRRILLEKYDTGIIALGDLLRAAYSALTMKQIPVLFDNIFKACADAERCV